MIESINAKFSDIKTDSRLAAFERSAVFPLLLLAGVTLLGLAMRFYKLGQWGFWIDEVLEIGYAHHAVTYFNIGDRISLWTIGLALNALGNSEWAARLVPAIVGILTIPVLYFPIRKLAGSTVALISALLLALSPWHLFWSQNARFYTYLLLFYALAQFALFFWLETDRLGYLVVAGIFFILAIQERMISAFFVPVVVTYLVALPVLRFELPKGFKRKTFLVLGIGGFIAAAAYLGLTNFLSEFWFYIVGHQHSSVRVLLSIAYDVGLPLFLTGLLGGVYLVLQKNRIGLYLLISAVVPVVLLVAIAPITQTFSRYVFMTLPSFIILAAMAAKELFLQVQKNARLLAVGLLLLLAADAVSQDVLYYGFQNGNREDFKGAFAIVSSMKEQGDLVTSTRPDIGNYYLGKDVVDSRELDLNQVMQSSERTWFVIDNRTFVSPELQAWLDEDTRLVGVRDVTVPGKTNMMRVYLYDPAHPVR